MKKNTMIFLMILLFLFLSGKKSIAGGDSVPFIWDKAANPLWGTKIYIGTAPGVYTNSEDAGKDTGSYNLENLQYATKYYFAAAHYLDGVESVKTEEISFTTKDKPETTFSPLDEIIEAIKSYTFTLTVDPK